MFSFNWTPNEVECGDWRSENRTDVTGRAKIEKHGTFGIKDVERENASMLGKGVGRGVEHAKEDPNAECFDELDKVQPSRLARVHFKGTGENVAESSFNVPSPTKGRGGGSHLKSLRTVVTLLLSRDWSPCRIEVSHSRPFASDELLWATLSHAGGLTLFHGLCGQVWAASPYTVVHGCPSDLRGHAVFSRHRRLIAHDCCVNARKTSNTLGQTTP